MYPKPKRHAQHRGRWPKAIVLAAVMFILFYSVW
jgi:hypothetical protein